MRVNRLALSDIAYQILGNSLDDDLGNCMPDLMTIEQCELALFFKRSLAEGKKRIVIDLVGERE